MATESQSPDSLYEIGKLYADRTDSFIAISRLQKAAEGYYKLKNYEGYLKCLNLLLRMYAEREEQSKIDETKEKLQDLVIKEKVQLNSKTYYTLGICASYKKQFKTALEYFEKSLAMALASDEKENICYAISGIVIVYSSLGRYEDALKEIYNLEVFFQVLDLPEIRLSSKIMNGYILRKLGKPEQALEVYWQCYDCLKTEKNLYLYVSLLYAMGVTYEQMGDADLARMYLTLARRSIDPENVKYMSRQLDKHLEALGTRPYSKYDLVYEAASKSIMEKKKGRVDFGNQFILLDLLRLFLNNPGDVFSKEDLVQKVWKQSYDPGVHDNKIYVTIKRLRKMIEPDYDKPKYIFRSKSGYYLNKDARILVD